MKENLFRPFSGSLALLCFLALGPLGLASAQEAVVVRVSGTAQLQVGDAWQALTVGQRLAPGSTVSAGFRSEIQLQIGPSTVTVKALSRLTLDRIEQSGSTLNTNLNLRVGRVNAEVNRTEAVTSQNFRIDSPVSTASVRGTSFTFDTQQLRVERGLVDLTDIRGQRISVPSGEGARAALPNSRSVTTANRALAQREASLAAGGGPSLEESEDWENWDYATLLNFLSQYYWSGGLPALRLWVGGVIADTPPPATYLQVGGVLPGLPPPATYITIGGIE